MAVNQNTPRRAIRERGCPSHNGGESDEHPRSHSQHTKSRKDGRTGENAGGEKQRNASDEHAKVWRASLLVLSQAGSREQKHWSLASEHTHPSFLSLIACIEDVEDVSPFCRWLQSSPLLAERSPLGGETEGTLFPLGKTARGSTRSAST